jgi:hypothetical protein
MQLVQLLNGWYGTGFAMAMSLGFKIPPVEYEFVMGKLL